MRRAWTVAGALAVSLVGIGGAPQPVTADHCFGVVVEPSRGPAGTVFVIRANGGDPGIVTLFHEGSRVARYRLDDWGDEVRYRSTAADVGRWRVHLHIPNGDQPCGPDDAFTVSAAPDTATVGRSTGDVGRAPDPSRTPPTSLILALAALAGALLAGRRLARRL